VFKKIKESAIGFWCSAGFAILLVTLSACKTEGEKYAEYLEEMADVVASNKNDCDAMGDALDAFLREKGEDMVKAGNEIKGDGKKLFSSDADKEKLLRRLDAATERFFDGIEACDRNKKVIKAMSKFNDLNSVL
jgi:hypothetical protein